jgi:hypothetical protein
MHSVNFVKNVRIFIGSEEIWKNVYKYILILLYLSILLHLYSLSIHILFFYFYGMHPVVYLLDNMYLSISESIQQLLQ